MQNGLRKRQKHSKPRKHNATNEIATKEARQQPWRLGDMVLVHVTAFKGHHKIQDWWENREYVVERWPYPDVAVYVVCPRDGKGCSWTLHGNYLLPISSNIEQDEKDTPVAGVENTNTSTLVLPVDSELADAGPFGVVTSSKAGSTPQSGLNQPVPLRCSTWTTQNWLPWRYLNFSLLADTSLSGIWDAWDGLCICLHVISCLFAIFWGSTVWTHSTYSTPCLLSTTHFGIEGNSLNVVSMVDGAVVQRLVGPSATASPEKQPKE